MKNTRMLAGMIAGLLALGPVGTNAAGVIAGKIVAVRVDRDGRAMAFFDQRIGSTPPACVHDAYKSALSFDASTPGGKAVLAAVLMARANGATVTAYGRGACDVYGGHVEDWDYGVTN